MSYWKKLIVVQSFENFRVPLYPTNFVIHTIDS